MDTRSQPSYSSPEVGVLSRVVICSIAVLAMFLDTVLGDRGWIFWMAAGLPVGLGIVSLGRLALRRHPRILFHIWMVPFAGVSVALLLQMARVGMVSLGALLVCRLAMFTWARW